MIGARPQSATALWRSCRIGRAVSARRRRRRAVADARYNDRRHISIVDFPHTTGHCANQFGLGRLYSIVTLCAEPLCSLPGNLTGPLPVIVRSSAPLFCNTIALPNDVVEPRYVGVARD